MKKRIFSILLCLCMVLMLFPVTALAEEPGSLTVMVSGFEVGKTPNDCSYTFESTIPGVTFSKDDIQHIYWHVYAADGDYYPVSNTDAFQAGKRYRLVIDLDSKGLTEAPAVTVNGNTPDYCTLLAGALGIGCDIGTPVEPGSLSITVEGFEVGKKLGDCTFTFKSTIPGVTFSEDDILSVQWEKYSFNGMGYGWLTVSKSEVFEADTRYQCFFNLDNKGLTEAPAVTVNGNTPKSCGIATSDGVPVRLQILCDIRTPAPLSITGANEICSQQDYEFTVTALAGVTIGSVCFGNDYVGSEVILTPNKDGVLRGVVRASGFAQYGSSFKVFVYGAAADGTPVTATKTVRVSPKHIYVDGVCGCGAVQTYTVQYDGGADFGLMVDFKTHGVDLPLAGETFKLDGYVQSGWVDASGKKYDFGELYTTDADVTLYPVWDPIVTLTVPFTTTVKLGGTGEPGKTDFEVALIDSQGNELLYDDAYFSVVVTTEGAGDYDGELTITAPLSWLMDMLYEGAFVRQYDDGEEGWTYDDTVWGVRLYKQQIAARAVSDVQYSLLVYQTYTMDDGSFALHLNAGPVDAMTFTNTYTKLDEVPKTGDNGNLTLWVTLLTVSVAGMIGTAMYSKRRGSFSVK